MDESTNPLLPVPRSTIQSIFRNSKFSQWFTTQSMIQTLPVPYSFHGCLFTPWRKWSSLIIQSMTTFVSGLSDYMIKSMVQDSCNASNNPSSFHYLILDPKSKIQSTVHNSVYDSNIVISFPWTESHIPILNSKPNLWFRIVDCIVNLGLNRGFRILDWIVNCELWTE